MASKPTHDELVLNSNLIDGTEQIRIAKREATGQRNWFNWRISSRGFVQWILSQIVLPPASIQLQSNWTETSTSSVSYIRNKPSLFLTKIKISSADTAGDTYTNIKLVGLDETTDFCLWTDEGSGTLVDFTDGINIYDSTTGTFTIPQQKYVLLIFKQ